MATATHTPTAQEANMFPNHSTAELLAMNATYVREYRANPTEGNLAAVNATSIALSARGA